jgi:hypothetical protein
VKLSEGTIRSLAGVTRYTAGRVGWVEHTTDEDQRRMKLMSVNTGLPREVTWHGRSVATRIFKQPVHGRIALRKLNL